jgi:hypothetical protein
MPNARSRTIWPIGPDTLGRLRWKSAPTRLCSNSESVGPMHPSSCFAARLSRSAEDQIPYSKEALRQDLTRVRNAWDECQAHRERDAIYSYLTAVFDLVAWWAAENCALARARKALQLQGVDLRTTDEPFAAIILATADRQKVGKRTRSKWSRVMRYAAEYKSNSEPLAAFIRRKGGINECASRFTRCFGRARRS